MAASLTHLADSLAAWLLVPAALYAVAVGLGLLVGRIGRLDLPPAVVPAVGLCAAIVVAMGGIRLGGGAWLALALLVGGALAGILLARGTLRRQLDAGWALASALAVYGLYMAPVVLSGGWTWTGYNFVNDTAIQFLLVDHLGAHGLDWPVDELRTEEQVESVSTSDASIYFYLRAAYPTGSHALLAAVKPLIPGPTAAQYVPFLATLAAIAAMALHCIAARLVRSLAAAVIAFAAMAANLTYNYHLQGNVKEVAALATFAAAAAVVTLLPGSRRPAAVAAVVGVAFAALLSVFGAAGAPFAGALASAALVAVVVTGASGGTLRAWLPRAVAAGVAALGVGVLIAASGLAMSFRVLTEVFGSDAGTTVESEGATNPVVSPLGHLLRPLRLAQVTGVWLGSDYRVPVPDSAAVPNGVLVVAVGALVIVGVVFAVRRRASGPLVALGAAGLTLAIVSPVVAPYASAKLLAIASPFVVLVAGLGACALGGLRRSAGVVAGVLVLGGILGSDALSYHSVKLAPTDRMIALEAVGDRFAGRGDVLLLENEEFGKYFLHAADDVAAFDPISPRQVQLRSGANEVGRFVESDGQVPAFLQSFPVIVQRRSPAASRPPANYRLEYQNHYYEAWVRTGPRGGVVDRLPMGTVTGAAVVPSCADVEAFAATARPGERLVGALRPEAPALSPAVSPHPPGWAPDPVFPHLLRLATPGRTGAPVTFEGGRYRVWVAGSFGRPIAARMDGRLLGEAHGIDSPGQWHLIGEVEVSPGRHQLALERPGGGLAPGDGHGGVLGPLTFEPVDPIRFVDVAPERARRLCGLSLDWVERVRA